VIPGAGPAAACLLRVTQVPPAPADPPVCPATGSGLLVRPGDPHRCDIGAVITAAMSHRCGQGRALQPLRTHLSLRGAPRGAGAGKTRIQRGRLNLAIWVGAGDERICDGRAVRRASCPAASAGVSSRTRARPMSTTVPLTCSSISPVPCSDHYDPTTRSAVRAAAPGSGVLRREPGSLRQIGARRRGRRSFWRCRSRMLTRSPWAAGLRGPPAWSRRR